ncbi:MAG: hypothetical protein IK088_01020 [Lachnospiraceae bacterium]|nr:hypothetical protein [Lachnospiraceae bacterium]
MDLNESQLRQAAVDYMVEMGSIRWTSEQTFDYSFNSKLLVYEAGKTFLGMVYNNGQSGLEAFLSVLDSDHVYRLNDTGWDTAPGNSCATSIRHVWQLVSPDVEFNYSIDMMPVGSGKGMVSVGKIRWDLYDGKNTTESILKHTPTEDVLQSYAEAEPGDAMMRYLDKGGHALLVTKPAKVKRNPDGTIDPDGSFMYLTDQNNLLNTVREYPSSWKIDRETTFTKALDCGWLPVSIAAFRAEKVPMPEVVMYGAPTAEALKAGIGLSGELRSNYCMTSVGIEIRKGKRIVSRQEVYPYARSILLSKVRNLPDTKNLKAGSYELRLRVKAGLYCFETSPVTFEIGSAS